MYVTRPLSVYRNEYSPSAEPELEGPNTGILVMEDEAAESRWLFGLLKRKSVKAPPFPQNKILELRYTTNSGEHQHTDYLYALLIPVLNRPSSSNQYYVIKSRGKKKGLACTSSKDDDETRCCCFGIPDTPPQLFDPTNAYQQFQISNYVGCAGPCGFVSKSVAPDGVPPRFLRRKGWSAHTKTFKNNFEPAQALGLDAALRARLPDLRFSLPAKSSDPVVVGKWYCPFIFVRDGEVGSQMSNSPYYEMTLHQNWKEIFGCENLVGGGRVVDFDVRVEREVGSVAGQAAGGRDVGDGFVWFGSSGVGLSLAIVERVKWEEERAGFEWVVGGKEKKFAKVKRGEKYGGVGEWRRFGCYVLVETFVLKRMDGTLVLTWEFWHTRQIRTKWE